MIVALQFVLLLVVISLTMIAYSAPKADDARGVLKAAFQPIWRFLMWTVILIVAMQVFHATLQ